MTNSSRTDLHGAAVRRMMGKEWPDMAARRVTGKDSHGMTNPSGADWHGIAARRVTGKDSHGMTNPSGTDWHGIAARRVTGKDSPS